MGENTPRSSCLSKLLDVRSYVIAARRSSVNAEPAAALFMALIFGLIALALFPLWVTFDLMSTWDFTTAIRFASEDAIYDMAYQVEGWTNLSVGAALAGIVFTSFTLLPSLFELAFPAVSHPLLNLVLIVSVTFDYVVDWPKASALASQWTDNSMIAFVYSVALTAFLSVGVQALLVVAVTVVIFSLLALVRGGTQRATVIIDQQ